MTIPREPLDYNNPLGQKLEKCWYKRAIFYYLDLGPVSVSPKAKVADIYITIKGFDSKNQPIQVEGQYNIFDTVPGDVDYSPLWKVNWVIVPSDYVPNTLRSKQDVFKSGYKTIPADLVIN